MAGEADDIGEDLYVALTRKKWQKVRDLCDQHPEGPFLVLTERRDSVLQKVLYSGNENLVLELLHDAKNRYSHGLEFEQKLADHANTKGSTVLHVAATQDSCIHAAAKILEHAPQLLLIPNNKDESPIFPAVRYGQLKMFKYLNCKVQDFTKKFNYDEEDLLPFYKVDNDDTHESYNILHVAIYHEHFELALYIAQKFPALICEEDHNKMTGLQMLAMNSSAFRNQDWKWLKRLLPCPFRRIASAVEKDAVDDNVEVAAGLSFTMTIPWWDTIKKAYRRYQAALQLADILVDKDTMWIDKVVNTTSATNLNNPHDDDDDAEDCSSPASNQSDEDTDPAAAKKSIKSPNQSDEDTEPAAAKKSVKSPNQSDEDTEPAKKSVKSPTPLVLATKYGCSNMALKIIDKHPQTIEQVGPEHGSILHLAIKHRRTEIFDAVEKMEMQMRRLARLLDDEGNSILHMVALNTTKVKDKNGNDATSTDKPQGKLLHPWDAEEPDSETRSPAFELQDDLLLFERVEKLLKTHFHKTPNKSLRTADKLFYDKKEVVRDAAQEWMKRTAENCSLVAVLIATVAFAAAYTVPGGTKDDDGSPVLLKETFFVVFTIADVLSLASTLTAVVVFLSILCSAFRFEDFRETLPKSLMFGISCLVFSLTMMMLAFAATIILMIKNKQEWTKIALYAVAFLPVTVLVATYLPFYVPLMKTFHYTIDKLKAMLPEFRFKNPTVSQTKAPQTHSDPSGQV